MKVEKFKTSKLPDFQKPVRLYCYDWSPYMVIGHREKSNKGPGWVFMVRDQNGKLSKGMNHWKDCEEWEYISEVKR